MSIEADIHSVDDCSPVRVLERVDEAVCAIDDEWQFSFVNERAASLLNRTPGELLGNEVWNVMPELKETVVGDRLREAMTTQASARFESYDEEAERWFRFRIYPAEDGATVWFSDVTDTHGEESEQGISDSAPNAEQKRREEAFGESSAFLKKTQEIATIGGYEVNLETGSTQWTDEVYRIHDLPADETVTLEKGVNFYHPADKPKIETALERLATDGEPYDLKLRIVTADDRLRWVRTIGDPQFDGDGNVVGIVGVVQDITENKRLENSLRDSERSLRKLTSIASDTDRGFESKLASLLELGTDRLDIPYGFLTRIEDGIQHIVRATGDHSQIQTGASVPQSESYCRKTIQQDEPLVINDAVAEGWGTDAAYRRSDFDCYIGGTITVGGESYGTLCFADTHRREHEFGDAERAFVKLLVQWISHELTTRSFETKLRELNETAKRLMSATSKSQVASVAIESARSILNIPIAGVWWYDDDTDALVPECMTEQAGEYIDEQPTFEDGAALAWDAFTTGETQVYDDLRTVSGIYNEETVLRSEVIIPLGDYGIMTTGSTDQRAFSETDLKLLEVLSSTVEAALGRAEREMVLRQTQADLERSNEELEQFAYAASHDLQEPLRTVSSYLTLLERRYGDELDDDAADFIEFAVDGADRMRSMIRALLAYSRVDTHGESFEAVDISALFERVVDDLEVKIAETDATVSTPTTEMTVIGDRNQLAQLFQNLIENGIKYNTTDPEISISVAHRDEMVVFEVTDDGIGMESDQIDEVFEVFHRLHTREEFAGTGIGLSICRKIVDRHGGTIGVDSEPGEGSTFILTLPSGEPPDE